MEVISPFIIAKLIIAITGHSIPESWKNAIVPKSPIEQPIRHHIVLYDALRQVCLHRQFAFFIMLISTNLHSLE